ncbi:MAG: hypothetical protein KDA84_05105 [Planctomycetaceae bacterium]|nr:hypothetical protein [Planctomycetaceae bacterium]
MSTGISLRAAAIVALVTIAASSANAFEYAIDDGSGNYTIGPSQFDAQMLWGNYFDAVPDQETITSISVSFAGSVPLDRQVSVLLFEDPTDDLDPTDASLVAQGSGLTAAAPVNSFLEFDIPDTQVDGGFFVGVLMDLAQHETPARMDPQNPQGRSWLFFDGEIDLGDLSSAPIIYNMANTPFNGNWMVRATGVPEPNSLFYVVTLGVIALLRRLN